MKTIAIVNLKGGVAKSTTAINMATTLAKHYQKRVLVVDADPQANATMSLLPEADEGEYNALSCLLRGEAACYAELVFPSKIQGLDVLPSDDSLWDVDLDALEGRPAHTGALRDLRDAVIEDDAYDYIIVDCPPSISPSFAAAIAASNSIIIPIKVDRYSVKGMRELERQIERVRRIHHDVRVSGCLITIKYRGESVQLGEELLRQQSPVRVFDTDIRRSPKVDDSTWAQQPVVIWSPNSAAGRDYREFVAEWLELEEGIARG